MLEINGNMYDLRYTIKRLEMIEKVTGKGTMSCLVQANGMLSIFELKNYLGYGLINDKGNYISPQQGIEYAEALIQSEGYERVITVVLESLQRDCSFLFPKD